MFAEGKVYDLPELRGKERVFADREEAGRVLAGMLEKYRGSNALVLAIPAGGVPVAAVLAEELGLELDVAVVSKITLPWTTEAGYGAVAFDGTLLLNQELISYYGLTEEEIEEGRQKTAAKVARRVKELRGDRPFPQLKGRPVILVDDGLASGFTMLTAIQALQKLGADRLIVAVPTAHWGALERVAPYVEAIYCPNIRSGWRFAVADAYELWYDVSEEEVKELLSRHNGSR
ncbi:phosphoribosyltransferase [Ammonifex thiophilus]|uniref:Phosphoribosyltransferase n=2 Tax=Ammonifex thiophilus TaxID=444093 RepID=A0A3D8P3X3_9THEO|nr:phosphoribosyltransferase [Ammonifex thiophilus]